MAKYDKNICTELKKRHMLPGPTPEERDKLAAEGLRISMEHVLWIDDEVIPGAYYGESTWIWPSSYPNQISWADAMKRSSNNKPMFPHAHDFPELLSWWGTDPDNPEDTTSMGMLMEDEEIPLDRSWIAYIPAGMTHMPTRPPGGKISTRPVCHWTSGPGGVYTREKDKESTKPEAGKKQNLKKQIETGELRNAKYIVLVINKAQRCLLICAKSTPSTPGLWPISMRRSSPVRNSAVLRSGSPGENKAGQLMMDAHACPMAPPSFSML
jgi:hypothetical protein